MAITWDANFEASPKDTDEAKYGAEKIRDLKLAISERLELEMNFKTGTQPLIKAGKAAVIFMGTTTEINALTGMSTGAFAWDTTLNALKRYSGTEWVILNADHGALLGLADDDHTQYLNLTKAGQELTQNLAVAASKTVDGRDISADGARLDMLPALKFMATPVNKINWTAATDWTDVDISADTGADTAKAALLAAQLDFNATFSGNDHSVMTGLLRKNGSLETAILPRIRGDSINIFTAGQGSYSKTACMLIAECDSSEIFEVKLQTEAGTPLNIVFKVDLIGYFV